LRAITYPGSRKKLSDIDGTLRYHFQLKMPFNLNDRMNVATLLTTTNTEGSFCHLYTTKGNESLINAIEEKRAKNMFELKAVVMDVLDFIEAKPFVDEDGTTGLDLQ